MRAIGSVILAAAALVHASAAHAGDPAETALGAVRRAWVEDGAAAAERVAALRLAAVDDDPAARGRLLAAVAWLRAASGDPESAFDLWTAIADPASGSGAGTVAGATGAIARAQECAGHPAEAARTFRDALAASRAEGPWTEADLLVASGRASAAAGDDPAAVEAFRAARRTIARFEIDHPALRAAALDGLADALRRAGDADGAGKAARERATLGEVAPDPTLDPCTVRPLAIAGARPAYPAEARRERLSAQVVVRCRIDGHGVAERCEAIGGSARFPVFAADAARALESWTWLPALVSGRPAAVDVHVDLGFTLR